MAQRLRLHKLFKTQPKQNTQAARSTNPEFSSRLGHHDCMPARVPQPHQATEPSNDSAPDDQSITSEPSSLSAEESPYGLKELVGQPSDKRHAVDIIAVHGLNGHYQTTWVDKASKVNWLCEASCLPRDVPNARILSFGYNSATYFSRADSDIQDFASELLSAIKSCRRSNIEKSRPLVFICHSLGGLVFKQAVIRAHEQNHFYATLLASIKGVIFFATPHRGSELAFWDSLGTRIVRAATLSFTTNTRLSKGLKVNSEMLKHISESFAYRGWSFKIRSFYETELMPGLNCHVVDKYSARLGWGNELDIASAANHSTICKFASSADQRYQTAIDAILDVISMPDNVAEHTLSDIEKRCMSQLNSDYELHLDQVDDPVPGTCSWVLSHKQWLEWQSHQESSLIWITSNAGCGKSVIAKFLVSFFQSVKADDKFQTFGYFFFMENIASQDNAAAAVSALLHQLYLSQPRLIQHALKKFTSTPSHVFGRFSTLWSILLDTLNDPCTKDILWVIDGLEECENNSLGQFVRALATFLESRAKLDASLGICSLRVILLSRPSSLIQQAFGLYSDKNATHVNHTNMFRLIGENETQVLSADILLFARWKMNELASASALPQNVMQRLQERLVNGADFTFLWISLVIKVIEDSTLNGISIAKLESILNRTNLHDIYEHLLEGPSKAYPSKTRTILSVILAAVRPLALEEVCVAVEVEQTSGSAKAEASDTAQVPNGCTRMHACANTRFTRTQVGGSVKSAQSNSQSLDKLGQQLHKPFDNHVRQLCGHFVRIRCRKLYLVHQTARTFLITASFRLGGNSHPGRTLYPGDQVADSIVSDTSQRPWQSLTLQEAVHTLLKICVSYIKIFAREEEDGNQEVWGEQQVASYLEGCKMHPLRAFFPYAAIYWVYHYRSIRKKINFEYDEMLQPNTNLFNAWAKVHPKWRKMGDASTHVPGAMWIKQEDSCLQGSETTSFFALWTWYNLLADWVEGVWYSKSDSPAIRRDIIMLREKFILNPKYQIAQEFFACDPVRTLFQSEPDTNARHIWGGAKTISQKLEQLEIFIETCQQEWFQARNECTGHESLLVEPRPNSTTIHAETVVKSRKRVKMQELFLDALLHFDIIEVDDFGLDEDEFLSEYCRPRDENSVSDLHFRNEEVEGKSQGDDYVTGRGEANIPDWIKHYIRQREKLASARYKVDRTPGADLPELSNPESRFFSKDMETPWQSNLSNRR